MPEPSATAGSIDVVSREDLERRLDEVRATVADPRAGLFGPTSKLWEVNRHAIMFLAGGRALLLQAAHPFVAHGVEQHSVSFGDPVGRFQRTFTAVFDMVYGDLDTAFAAARRTYARHRGIHGAIQEDLPHYPLGAPYHANHAEALFWVHATLWESSVLVFEQFVRPLSAKEKDLYYQDTLRFAYLFGIPDRVIPESWDAFMAYNRQMWDSATLGVGRPALQIADFLFRPENPLHGRVLRWYRPIVGAQLPPRLRIQYGLPDDPSGYERSARRIKRVENHLPSRLRYLPAYLAALRRLQGRPGRDRLGELLGRAFVGRRGPEAPRHPTRSQWR